MFTLKMLGAAAVAGLLTNGTGYLITGRLFHPYQATTPDTWRKNESWNHYLYATLARIAACIAIAFLYSALGTHAAVLGEGALSRGVGFGSLLWLATILPMCLEVALFVNWHRAFVAGLLIDWLVVCVLASTAAALVAGPL